MKIPRFFSPCLSHFSLLKSINAWLIQACLLLACVGHADTLVNPIGALITPNGPMLNKDQFLGARFQFSTPVDIVLVGGQFDNLYGSYFAALVPLNSLTALPVGDPGSGVAFNPGEVLDYRIFSSTLEAPEFVTVPFSTHLNAGCYAVVFGSGLFGASAGYNGHMQEYAELPEGTGFFWGNHPYRWQNLNGEGEPWIEITFVPEPSISFLFLLGFIGLLIIKLPRRTLRLSSGAHLNK